MQVHLFSACAYFELFSIRYQIQIIICIFPTLMFRIYYCSDHSQSNWFIYLNDNYDISNSNRNINKLPYFVQISLFYLNCSLPNHTIRIVYPLDSHLLRFDGKTSKSACSRLYNITVEQVKHVACVSNFFLCCTSRCPWTGIGREETQKTKKKTKQPPWLKSHNTKKWQEQTQTAKQQKTQKKIQKVNVYLFIHKQLNLQLCNLDHQHKKLLV